MRKSIMNGIIVGTVAETVRGTRSDELEGRAVGTIARHMHARVDYEDYTGWVLTHPNGRRYLVEPYLSLEWNMRVDGPSFRSGNLCWSGQYRMEPLE